MAISVDPVGSDHIAVVDDSIVRGGCIPDATCCDKVKKNVSVGGVPLLGWIEGCVEAPASDRSALQCYRICTRRTIQLNIDFTLTACGLRVVIAGSQLGVEEVVRLVRIKGPHPG